MKEVKAFPNHYGLYFKKDGKSYYANYEFVFKKGIIWKKGSPLYKIEIKNSKTKNFNNLISSIKKAKLFEFCFFCLILFQIKRYIEEFIFKYNNVKLKLFRC